MRIKYEKYCLLNIVRNFAESRAFRVDVIINSSLEIDCRIPIDFSKWVRLCSIKARFHIFARMKKKLFLNKFHSKNITWQLKCRVHLLTKVHRTNLIPAAMKTFGTPAKIIHDIVNTLSYNFYSTRVVTRAREYRQREMCIINRVHGGAMHCNSGLFTRRHDFNV